MHIGCLVTIFEQLFCGIRFRCVWYL